MPSKSILKNTVVAANEPSKAAPVNQKHLDTAIHHANIIEQRKQVETQVLDAIVELMDFPPAAHADPQRPSAADAARFEELLIPFQPSDYDALIEERNIADHCGYALCPRPKRRAPSTARKHLVDTANGVQVVDRKALEIWCSDDCARRALYVKVQLNEEPAWLRGGGYGGKIQLLADNRADLDKALPVRVKAEEPPSSMQPSEDDEIATAWATRGDALAALSLERGETSGAPSKASKDVLVTEVKERVVDLPPTAPFAKEHAVTSSHLAIEGHIPRTDRKADDEPHDPQDWDQHLPS